MIYPWLSDEPQLNRAYLPLEYRQITAGITIEKMIFIECEADFVQYRAEVD